MKNGKIKLIIFLFIIFTFYGCSVFAPYTRTVYVPEGDAIMLRQDVPDVKIWAKPSKTDDPVAGILKLQEGWF